ncbi:MAG: pirin family protein [Acidimicrobiia bacterium]|jgi:redox-sensitive bicupin YhaK (pirin superfamily)|nr:pirin family protein [Acidimicrobiia bacterium]MBP8181254.1 pirin family protein [Acidimicrobiia bacterium]
MTERKLRGVFAGDGFHWVGDGFYVTQVLPGTEELRQLADPFLLMDYHPVRVYEPTDTPRGVGPHPHRGFETVTLAFEGAVAHHDSTGSGGVIGPGDVQWMTAAGGILHKEYHDKEWAKTGGRFHMMQLWVNLPGKHKMDPPRYQPILASQMGKVALAGGGEATLIAGSLDGIDGPAATFTPIELWDVTLGDQERAEIPVPDGHTIMVFPIEGHVSTGDTRIDVQTLGVFERTGDSISLSAGEGGARFIVLGGEPIKEPVIFYGPFAMNTREEILRAIEDLERGEFGYLE